MPETDDTLFRLGTMSHENPIHASSPVRDLHVAIKMKIPDLSVSSEMP